MKVRPGLRRAAASLRRHLIEQEIRERESGERAAVGERSEQAVVAGVEAALRVVKELAADLERMVALQPRDLVVELIRSVERVGVGRDGPDCREARVQCELAEAGNRLTAGNPERRVRVPDAAPVERPGHDRDLIEADQDLVDEGRIEDTIPVERDVAERRVGQAAEQQRRGPLVVARLVFGDRDASEHLVPGRGVPVDAHIALMGVRRRQRVADEIAADTAADGPIRERVERRVAEECTSGRADPAGGYLVARERLSGERVANDGAHARQIAATPFSRRHRDRLGSRRVEPDALVVAEDKPFVLLQRAAQRTTEDVLRPLRFRRVGPVVVPRVRVEVAVAVELEDVAPDEVRAGLGDVADHGACDVPRVRGVVVRLDADLGERVGTGLIGHEVVDRLVHVDAVDDVVVRLLAVPVHVRPPAAEVANGGERSRVHAHHARQQQRQLPRVAPVQRQPDDRRARDHFTDRHRLGLQKRRLAGDQDGLLDRTELQVEIEPHGGLRLDLNCIGRCRLEA